MDKVLFFKVIHAPKFVSNVIYFIKSSCLIVVMFFPVESDGKIL